MVSDKLPVQYRLDIQICYTGRFDSTIIHISIVNLLQSVSALSVPHQNSASEGTIWDFDVRTVPVILTVVGLGPIGDTQLYFSYWRTPTMRIVDNCNPLPLQTNI